MDQMLAFDAILFPADERPPHLVSLMTSPLATPISNPPEPYRCGRVPHPEMYMDYIAEGLGPRSWKFQVIEQLEGMTKKFSTPYIVFYPTVSRDGMPFPVNKCIKEIQADKYQESKAWRGNVIVAKFRDQEYASMMDATMADFPIVKNWLSKTPAP
ncbi:hypothetical protein DAEQUDRAFT_195611 [Daedalea quercina L-15889]|uniref:Uncharacterized protein n=1 Tax=Daedalea quercina L-15889 TaxID=1314783 RepID=A0A165U7B2_9APHY|nr:hypothetical protein DAEQUDRAFT_195611 [Daedalea quercina L-15889]